MAKIYGIVTNHFGGRCGKDLILQIYKGVHYVRAKPIPAYRRTPKQARVRDLLKEAVRLWQQMDEITKAVYNAACAGTGMSGYELSISLYIKSHW